MIDKIVYQCPDRVTVYLDSRIFEISGPEPLVMLVWVLSDSTLHLTEYARAVQHETEDTCDIILEVA
jgi:hypothetical protein